MIELSKYVFETLREDEEFAFCRGRTDNGEPPTQFGNPKFPFPIRNPHPAIRNSPSIPQSEIRNPHFILLVAPVSEHPAPAITSSARTPVGRTA
jgi:hypothetical protein